MAKHNNTDLWNKQAQQWTKIGSPLRPEAEDVALMRGFLGSRPGKGILLGVTPELTGLGDQLVAVERDRAMIEKMAACGQARHEVCEGDWRDMPLPSDGFDFAVGDGCCTQLRYPEDYQLLFDQLQRVLRRPAQLVLRMFLAPEPAQCESLDRVMSDATAGRIGSFHAFKWRFAMALTAGRSDPNIAVSRIHASFEAAVADRAAFARAAGWHPQQVDTIDAYLGSPSIYSFPTLSQFRAVLPTTWRETGIGQGGYELAERCPVIHISLSAAEQALAA